MKESLVGGLLSGAVKTGLFALLLWWLVGIPAILTFSIVYLLVVLETFEGHTGNGMAVAGKWGGRIATIALLVVAVVISVFFVAQVFGVYPIDALTHWNASGGFEGIFWGHQAPRDVLLELIVLVGVFGILWGLTRKPAKKWAKTMAIVFGCVIFFAAVFFQRPPEALARGQQWIANSVPQLEPGETLPMGNTSTSLQMPQGPCSKVAAYDFERKNATEVDVILRDNGGCLGQEVTLPLAFANGFSVSVAGEGHHLWFMCPNRTVTLLTQGKGAMDRCFDPAHGLAPRFLAGGHGIAAFKRLE